MPTLSPFPSQLPLSQFKRFLLLLLGFNCCFLFLLLRLRKSFRTHFRSMEGVQGVEVVQRFPFMVKDISGDAHSDVSNCECLNSDIGNQEVVMRRIWDLRPPLLRPIKCSLQGDQSVTETVVNVLTSLPFIALGLQAPRKNSTTTMYANSLIGVGVASSLYHASRGEVRKYLRWADYTMIATASLCLSRALRNENPRFFMAASAFALPFQPFMVSAVHAGLMEIAFAQRASTKPELRMAHNLHTMSTVLGGALFVADDVFPGTPYIHAAWHLAAAVGVGTCNKLLE